MLYLRSNSAMVRETASAVGERLRICHAGFETRVVQTSDTNLRDVSLGLTGRSGKTYHEAATASSPVNVGGTQ